MATSVNLQDIAVDDLREAEMAAVRGEVEDLGFDACHIYGLPLQILPSELGIGSRLGLFSNGLDCCWAINWLLSASDIGQPMGT